MRGGFLMGKLELNKKDDFKFFKTLVEAQNHFDLTL